MSDSIYTDEKLLHFLHGAARFKRADFDLERSWSSEKELGQVMPRRLYRASFSTPVGVALIGHSSGSGEKRGEEVLQSGIEYLWSKMKGIPRQWLFTGACRPHGRGDAEKP